MGACRGGACACKGEHVEGECVHVKGSVYM
jgi:hypothetical protein